MRFISPSSPDSTSLCAYAYSAPKVSTFKLKCLGQVASGQIPHKVPIAVNYVLVAGQDWKETYNADTQHEMSGVAEMSKTSISQYAAFRSTANIDEPNFVWNFPVDIEFNSTNPYGWPRLVLVLYDRDVLVKGYGSCLLPTTPGKHTRYVRMFVPASSSAMQEVLSDVRRLPPEFQDMNFPAKVSSLPSIDCTFLGLLCNVEFQAGILSVPIVANGSFYFNILT